MKKIILVSVVSLFAIGAQASYMQNSCSNADGTVKTFSGHSRSVIVIEDQKLGRRDLNIKQLQNLNINSETTGSCESSNGIVSHRSTSIQKVSISKKDGSDILNGQSEITAYLICERFVSNMIFCPKPQ